CAHAEPLYHRALEIRKQVLGEKHPDYACSLNNLAFLYGEQGDYTRAEALFRQALQIRKQVLGEKHPEYASSLSNLALLYMQQRDYPRAEALYRQAIASYAPELDRDLASIKQITAANLRPFPK